MSVLWRRSSAGFGRGATRVPWLKLRDRGPGRQGFETDQVNTRAAKATRVLSAVDLVGTRSPTPSAFPPAVGFQDGPILTKAGVPVPRGACGCFEKTVGTGGTLRSGSAGWLRAAGRGRARSDAAEASRREFRAPAGTDFVSEIPPDPAGGTSWKGNCRGIRASRTGLLGKTVSMGRSQETGPAATHQSFRHASWKEGVMVNGRLRQPVPASSTSVMVPSELGRGDDAPARRVLVGF